jgi:hypothetical protein
LLLLSHDPYLVTLIIIVGIIMGMSSSFIMLIHPAQSLLFNSGSRYYRKDCLVSSCGPLYQGRISGGGHGIPSVSLRPAVSSLCARQGAIPGSALGPLQGWPPAGQVTWGRPLPPWIPQAFCWYRHMPGTLCLFFVLFSFVILSRFNLLCCNFSIP